MAKKSGNDFNQAVFTTFLDKLKSEFGEKVVDRYFTVKNDAPDYFLSSRFNDRNLLDVTVTVSGREATISYHNDSYDNYSELWPPEGTAPEAIGKDLFEIVKFYLRNGAIRRDKYVGRKLVSSTLEVEGQDKTQAVKGFKLFGKRTVKTTSYTPPLPK